MIRALFAVLLALVCGSTQAATIYYCKCDTGAGTGCTTGLDANPGTSSAAPKLSLPSTSTLNASGAGGQHLFCRTGAWDDANNGIFFTTANTATAANPIVVGAYSPSWLPTATVTISNASPAVVTWTSHGLSVGDQVVLTTTGTLPSPLVAGDTVYVKSVPDANTFTVSKTAAGPAINTVTAGSGTHTAVTGNVPRINSTTTSSANNCFRIFGVASNIVFRDFKCVGLGYTSGGAGLYLWNIPDNITFNNVEVSGYTHGLNVDTTSTSSASRVTLINSYIHDNWAQGVFGCGVKTHIENNTIDNNGDNKGNATSIDHNHNMYCTVAVGTYRLSGVIRGNLFTRSAVNAGICKGNDIEMHNRGEDLLVENNVIDESTGAGNGCYGIEANPGNAGAVEGFDNLVIRGNTIINVGSFGVSLSAVSNSQVVNNKLIWTQGQTFTRFAISDNGGGTVGEDLPDSTNRYINNSIYYTGSQPNDRGIYLKSSPIGGNTGHVVSGNAVYFASGTSVSAYCYEIAGGLTSSSFTSFDRNQCYRSGGSNYMLVGATSYATLASAQPTWDPNGSVADPGLVAAPSSANNWSLDYTSAITADTAYCPILGFHSIVYTGTCLAGATKSGFSTVAPASPIRVLAN